MIDEVLPDAQVHEWVSDATRRRFRFFDQNAQQMFREQMDIFEGEERVALRLTGEAIASAPWRSVVVEILDANFAPTGEVLWWNDTAYGVLRLPPVEIAAIRAAPRWFHEDTVHASFRWSDAQGFGVRLSTRYLLPSGHALCHVRLPISGLEADLRDVPGDSSGEDDDLDGELDIDTWLPVVLNVEAERESALFNMLQWTPRLFSRVSATLDSVLRPPNSTRVGSVVHRSEHLQVALSARTAWLDSLAVACEFPNHGHVLVMRDMSVHRVEPLVFFSAIAIAGPTGGVPVWTFANTETGQVLWDGTALTIRARDGRTLARISHY